MSSRAAALLFLFLASALGMVGFWLDNWWAFAGAVVAAAAGGLALTEHR